MPSCVNFCGICPDCALDQGLFVVRGLRLYKCAADDCDGRGYCTGSSSGSGIGYGSGYGSGE